MRSSMRARVVTLGIAALVACAACVAVASAGTLQPVQLPRDHGAHAGFSVEWWYATGHASGAHGRRYFWFATIWTAPQGTVGRVNVVDLARDRVVLSRQYVTAGQFAPGATDLRVDALHLAWTGATPFGRIAVDATTPDASLRMRLVAQRPYVLHGRHGIIGQGPNARSAYYSGTRLTARGRLLAGGRELRLRGRAWFDHQWGDFAQAAG